MSPSTLDALNRPAETLRVKHPSCVCPPKRITPLAVLWKCLHGLPKTGMRHIERAGTLIAKMSCAGIGGPFWKKRRAFHRACVV